MENLMHLKAPGDWMNDPNGFIYYKGEYHLFFQYFPCAPHWGTMHWGHAVSEDLIHWKHLGIALYPSKKYDGNGVFSGSAVERDGQLWIYYTAVQYLGCDPDNIHHALHGSLQSQALLISDDGRKFDNTNRKQQIIPPYMDPDIADAHDCRDPKVWKEQNTWYMTLGSTNSRTHMGVLLLLESQDGLHWKSNSRVEDQSLGHTLECPDLFRVDDKQILICSPMGNMLDSEYPENQATIRFAEFSGEADSLRVEQHHKFFDYGMELYAPQSTLDRDGNRTVVAWLRMPGEITPDRNTASNGRPWNGMISLPRVVSIRDGEIFTSVHPEVRRFFSDMPKQIVSDNGYEETVVEENHRITAALCEGQSLNVHGIRLSLTEGRVILDRSEVIPSDKDLAACSSSPVVGASCDIEIYLEPNVIEVYINDGQYVITNWINGIQ